MSEHRLGARVCLVLLLVLLAGGALHAQSLYWENPRIFVPQGVGSSSSAAGPSLMVLAWQEITPRSATDRTSGDIYLSLAASRDGSSWQTHPRFFGPIHYTGVTEGGEPRVYSLAIDARDRITVAIAAADRETLLLESVDDGKSFKQVQRLTARASTGVPNLFTTGGGGFLLLISQGSTSADVVSGRGTVSLAFSHSRDGRSWSEIAPFTTPRDEVKSPQLQPAHAVLQGRDYVVFESLAPRSTDTNTWQLYAKSSADGGATWDPAVAVTTQDSLSQRNPRYGTRPLDFDNERPRLTVLGAELGLVWERSPFGTNRPQIWSVRLDARAAVAGSPEVVASDAPSRFAHVLLLKDQEYILYADGSKGTSRIVLARQKGRTWDPQPLLNTALANANFPHAVQFKSSLYIFWENQPPAGGASSLVQLKPLTSVGQPVLKAVDFTPGQPANRDTVTVSWTEPQPPDPSGIRVYRYTWTYSDGASKVEKERQSVSGLTAPGKAFYSTRRVDKDGTWTFSIVAEDLAGNVTAAPATVAFTRDATPPRAVGFAALGVDGTPLLEAPSASPDNREAQAHALDRNTFALKWLPSDDRDVVGYTYNVQPGWATLEEYARSKVPLIAPPRRVVTTDTQIPFRNSDNGVYVVTVQAVDRAGNFGPPSAVALGLSNYQVVTRIDFVGAQKDPVLGTLKLTILGRGFTDNGAVSRIYLDRGHDRPPWDMEFEPTAPISVSDRQISGIVLDDNRESGAYRIGLLQRRPGGQEVLYFTPEPMINFQSPGTVKVGNFQILLPRWIAGPSPRYMFSFDGLLVILVVALLGALAFLAFRKIVALAQENVAVRTEVLALLQGRPNAQWEERKKRMQALKRKGIGLRLKFTLLMVVLVTMIVLIVSIPLGFQMVNKQRYSLATGLQNSANILLGALASSAETQFRQQDQGFLGAVDMPNLRSTMPEAVYTTITGPDRSFKPTDPKDVVWASDEKRFADELKAGQFNIAAERVGDELAKTIVPGLQKKIDTEGMAKLRTLVDDYRNLRGQQGTLQGKTDAASRAMLAAVTDKLAQTGKDIDTQARGLYAQSGTLEPFNPNRRLGPRYLFYRPVIFFNRAANLADTTFYQGMIRLEVKTDTINRQIDESVAAILRTAGGIALAAIALGILGAIIMTNITVTPIRRLARGVAVIRDTEDKEQLKDHTIEVKTRDEIGLLAETVNEMTRGLVKAAMANKELLLGKDVQKMFLPLEKDAENRKGTTAVEETKAVEIYGYYEGAKGVSGDYFDFKKLDETHYAFIKCDVAGKGVPAALIMVEVATLFISYFRDWMKRKDNIAQLKDPRAKQRALQELERIDLLVYTINDMLEERGFKGRFAALTICLFNSETGVANLCNAGDNIVHIYEASGRRMTQKKLPDSPAAGVFPSMLVEMKSGFKQVPFKLAAGDALFMFTDGFEEAKRELRDAAGQVMQCAAPEVAEGEPHMGTHSRGQTSEEFGIGRIEAIVTAVFAKAKYRLVRYHVPDPSEVLEFDFSSCRGTVQDAVLALVAVEKIFRLRADIEGGAGSRISVEAKVDAFLKTHFLQYGQYFAHGIDGAPGSQSLSFSHLKEDEQYDDLTILVLRKK